MEPCYRRKESNCDLFISNSEFKLTTAVVDIKTDGISLDFCEQNKFLEDVASAKMFIYLETRQVFLT